MARADVTGKQFGAIPYSHPKVREASRSPTRQDISISDTSPDEQGLITLAKPSGELVKLKPESAGAFYKSYYDVSGVPTPTGEITYLQAPRQSLQAQPTQQAPVKHLQVPDEDIRYRAYEEPSYLQAQKSRITGAYTEIKAGGIGQYWRAKQRKGLRESVPIYFGIVASGGAVGAGVSAGALATRTAGGIIASQATRPIYSKLVRKEAGEGLEWSPKELSKTEKRLLFTPLASAVITKKAIQAEPIQKIATDPYVSFSLGASGAESIVSTIRRYAPIKTDTGIVGIEKARFPEGKSYYDIEATTKATQLGKTYRVYTGGVAKTKTLQGPLKSPLGYTKGQYVSLIDDKISGTEQFALSRKVGGVDYFMTAGKQAPRPDIFVGKGGSIPISTTPISETRAGVIQTISKEGIRTSGRFAQITFPIKEAPYDIIGLGKGAITQQKIISPDVSKDITKSISETLSKTIAQQYPIIRPSGLAPAIITAPLAISITKATKPTTTKATTPTTQQITRPIQDIKVSQDIISIPSAISKTKQVSLTRIKTSPLVSQVPLSKVMEKTAVVPATAVATGVMSGQQIRQITQLTPITSTPTTPSITPPITMTPFVPPVPPVKFPSLAGVSGQLGIGDIKASQVTKYTPSYSAIVFGIHGKKTKPTKAGYTGFELRKITKGFSWANLFKSLRR